MIFQLARRFLSGKSPSPVDIATVASANVTKTAAAKAIASKISDKLVTGGTDKHSITTKRSQLVKTAVKPKPIRRVGLDALQRIRQYPLSSPSLAISSDSLAINDTRIGGSEQLAAQDSMRCFAYCTARQYDLNLIASSLPRTQFQVSLSPSPAPLPSSSSSITNSHSTQDHASNNLTTNFVHARFLSDLPDDNGGGVISDGGGLESDGDDGSGSSGASGGEVFFFKDGCAVTWNTSSRQDAEILRYAQLAAVERFDEDLFDIEEMQFSYDPEKQTGIYGEKIILNSHDNSGADSSDPIYVKLAFSHGLARSTQLGVLEKYLAKYLQSIANVPLYMMEGKHPPLSAKDVMRKHGQLLHIRGLLNLHTDLVDSEPDLYWTRADLARYFDSISRTLDTYPRIRILNQRLDYANQLIQLMRDNLSERHGIRLELIIIALITAEVGFEILHYLTELHYVDLFSWIGNTGEPLLPLNNSSSSSSSELNE